MSASASSVLVYRSADGVDAYVRAVSSATPMEIVEIERPQPALGGRKPADLIDTPTGVEVVARLLGSIESGAYQ